LIAAGADVNAIDQNNETALHKAASGGYLEIIELLLKEGADPNIREMLGELAVEQALPRKAEKIKALFKVFDAN